MNRRIHVGLFGDQATFLAAARECSGRGLVLLDAFMPHPIHEIEHLLGLRTTRLPWATLIGGALGLTLGLGFQYWSSAQDWPIDVGGKPWDSLPAFVPVAFEMTVLFAGLATVFGLFGRCGLWPGRKPRRALKGVTDDRYALMVGHQSGSVEWRDIGVILREQGALEQWEEDS